MITSCPDCGHKVTIKPELTPTSIEWDARCTNCKCEFSYDSDDVGGWEYEPAEVVVSVHGDGWVESQLLDRKLARLELWKRLRHLRLNDPNGYQRELLLIRTMRVTFKRLLEHASPTLVLEKFAGTSPMPKNKAKLIKFRRP